MARKKVRTRTGKLWSELKAKDLVRYMQANNYPLDDAKVFTFYGDAAYNWLNLSHHRPMGCILGPIQRACQRLNLPEIQTCFINKATKKVGDGCTAKMSRADVAKAVKAKPFPYATLLQAL